MALLWLRNSGWGFACIESPYLSIYLLHCIETLLNPSQLSHTYLLSSKITILHLMQVMALFLLGNSGWCCECNYIKNPYPSNYLMHCVETLYNPSQPTHLYKQSIDWIYYKLWPLLKLEIRVKVLHARPFLTNLSWFIVLYYQATISVTTIVSNGQIVEHVVLRTALYTLLSIVFPKNLWDD